MNPDPAHSSSRYRQVTFLVRFILSVVVAIYALGLFATVLSMQQTHFGNYLFMILEYPHGQAVFIEKITVSVFFSLALVNLFHTRIYTVLPVAAYIFFESWAGYYQGGYRFSEFTLYSHALRYVSPLGLLTLFCFPFNPWLDDITRQKITEWILRLAITAVFVMHGLMCIWGYPVFIDLIIGTSNNLLDIRVTETLAKQIMLVIGIVDLIVASLVLVKPWRVLLMWVIFWGTLTAFSRMTTLGSVAYIEVLFRASHMLAPLAVYIILYQPAWIFRFSLPALGINRQKTNPDATNPL